MYPYVAQMKKPLKNNNLHKLNYVGWGCRGAKQKSMGFLILEQGTIGPQSSSIK